MYDISLFTQDSTIKINSSKTLRKLRFLRFPSPTNIIFKSVYIAMPQANLTYDVPYNRGLAGFLKELDAKHWEKLKDHTTDLGYRVANFHNDYRGDQLLHAKMVGGSRYNSHVPAGNNGGLPLNLHAGLAVNSGGQLAGIDGAVSGGSKVGDQIASVAKTLAPFAPLLMGLGTKKGQTRKTARKAYMSGGYSFNDFIGDVAGVGKEVAPDLIRSYMKGGYSFNDFIGDVAHVGKEVAPDLIRAYASGAGRPKKRGGAVSKEQLVDLFNTYGMPVVAKASKTSLLNTLRGGYSFNDFIGDVAHVGKEVAPDLIRAYASGAGRKRASKKGGLSLSDVIDTAKGVGKKAISTIKEEAMKQAPAVKALAISEAKKLAPQAIDAVKRAVGGAGGRAKRAEIVKKVMKEKGLSMIQASSYVKQHGLY
jgi:hypothetical protein